MEIANLIPVEFYSYIDNLKGKSWPKYVCCRPMIGDLVRSECGQYAKVHSICHVKEREQFGEVCKLEILLTRM